MGTYEQRRDFYNQYSVMARREYLLNLVKRYKKYLVNRIDLGYCIVNRNRFYLTTRIW